MPKAGFYAVRRGRVPGIYTTWPEAEAQVSGFTGAQHKKFQSRAQAEGYIAEVPAAYPTAGPSKASNAGLKAQWYKENAKSQADASQTARRRVYTDGACSNNQNQKIARAGLGVHWPEGAATDLSEALPGPVQTNNRAELYAIYRALEEDLTKDEDLEVTTDSKYSIDCLTKFLPAWQRNGWKTREGKDVLNKDLVVGILELIKRRKGRATFKYTKGHASDKGNQEADRLAVAGAQLPRIPKMPPLLTETSATAKQEAQYDVVDGDMLMSDDELAAIEHDR